MAEPPGEISQLLRAWNEGDEETAEVLQVSPDTILRDWRMAKACLRRALKHREADDA